MESFKTYISKSRNIREKNNMNREELIEQMKEGERELEAIKGAGMFYPLMGLSLSESFRMKWNAKLLLNHLDTIERLEKLVS